METEQQTINKKQRLNYRVDTNKARVKKLLSLYGKEDGILKI